MTGKREPGQPPSGGDRERETCLVIHPRLKSAADRGRGSSPDEAVGLAQAINLDVLHIEIVPMGRRQPSTLFGSGTVARLGALVSGNGHEGPGNGNGKGISVVIVNAPLTPVQQRNLERAWQCKVIDRTGLILEIFGERARTREGRLQVELAALSYQRSRLVRSWTHLERQRGGAGVLGGRGET
ncbi:MAG: GTPase HflX, partial [Proteobacteria bacterium]|nr:GTPase HflX [Pseudomonadota bacterium]